MPVSSADGPVAASASDGDLAAPADADARRRVVLAFARLAHRAGMASDRLEPLAGAVAIALGRPATFFATPTAVMASFDAPAATGGGGRDAAHGTVVLRGDPGTVDLGVLARLERLGRRAIDDAAAEGPSAAATHLAAALDELERAPGPYSRTGEALGFAGASMVAGVLFGANTLELLACGLLGLVPFAILQAATTRPRLSGLPMLTASTIVAAAAPLAAWLCGGEAFRIALAALIVLVPGLTLTLAMREVAARHLVSGSARITGALVDFLAVAFGVAVGTGIGRAALEALLHVLPASPAAPAVGVALPAWVFWAAVLLAPLNLVVLFRAPAWSTGFVAVAGTAAIAAAQASASLHPALSAMLAAAVAGGLGNLVSGWTARRGAPLPPSVVIVPGIMLLVPGSLGMHATAALLADDPQSGLATAAAAVLAAGGLATGLLVANAAVPPPSCPQPTDRRATTPAGGPTGVEGIVAEVVRPDAG